MKKSSGFLDEPIVKERVESRMKQVRELHFSHGVPLVNMEKGKIYNEYADGQKVEVKILK